MADYLELVQRLRDLTDENYGDIDQFSTWGREMVAAADAIEHLMLEIDVLDYAWKTKNERIAELEAALKPFAEMTATIVDGMVAHSFTMDDIRAARKVLGDKSG